MSASIAIKRVYDSPSSDDGTRILIDRLWPRGLSKANAKIDHWMKDLAPSDELRKWFAHDPAKWTEFKRRYRAELKRKRDPLDALSKRARRGPVTLLYAAHDEQHNNAVALRDVLDRARAKAARGRPASRARPGEPARRRPGLRAGKSRP